MKNKSPNKAVFLDRDGTILKDCHYLNDPERIYIYPGVIPWLRKLKGRGWKLIIGTNQSGIGRGYLTLETLHKIHRRLVSIFRKENLKIDDILFCPHHPKDECACRKPKTQMILRAARKYRLNLKQCVVIGDKECDIRWGKNAGAKTVLVLTGRGRKALATSKVKADHVSRSLATAARWVLEREMVEAEKNLSKNGHRAA